MYEFSEKEMRRKFKSTEYGRKTNLWLYISLGVLGGIVLIGIIIGIILLAASNYNFESLIPLLSFLSTPIFITVIISCYFDGKRDGAIEQFKISQKK